MAVKIKLPSHPEVALQRINLGGFFLYNNGLFQKVTKQYGVRNTSIINVHSGHAADPEAFHPGLVVAPVDVIITVSYEEDSGL